MKFPSGSAGGADGLRPQHLKDLLSSASNDDPLLQAITDFINMMLEGRTPDRVRPIIFGASLLALTKRCGGVRPIAVGYVWRRLASKVACQAVTPQSVALLAPRQVGFGVASGCEGAIHAARRYTENMQDGQLLLKLDFKNAFNSIRRDSMLEAVALHLPSLYRFVESAYGETSKLRFGDFTISSEEGVQQGDPLGPLLFCITTQALLTSLKSEVVLGYLDDITLAGNHDTVLEDFVKVEEEAASIGLSLNRSKCEVMGHTAETRTNWSMQGIIIQETDPDEIVLLGASLSRGPGIDKALENKLTDLETLCKRLPLMPRHDSLFLLSNVVAMPRLLFTLRTTPCMSSPVLPLYDNLLRASLSKLINVDVSESAWEQASLPVRFGGLGIRSAVSLASSAFLASAAGATNLVNSLLPQRLHNASDSALAIALTVWQNQAGPNAAAPDGAHCRFQKSWNVPVCKALADVGLNAAQTEADRA